MSDPDLGLRVRLANTASIHADRDYVLYWMIAARRPSWNFALDRAIAHARAFNKPLVVFEPLEVDYPWASDRLHRFVIDGMRDNAAAFAGTPVTYFPYVEPRPGEGRGLLESLSRRACVIVTDEFPCFFLPKIVAAAASRVEVAMEVVDGNGLIPLAATERIFTAAAFYRRFMQQTLLSHIGTVPESAPLAGLKLPRLPELPGAIRERWAPATAALLAGSASELAALPIDHEVAAVSMRGGSKQGDDTLGTFITTKLPRYGELHSEPEADGTSRLSPYLHFGHVGAHQVFAAVMGHEGWTMRTITGKRVTGAREGWWGVSPSAERFLDQLTVWRELGFNMSSKRPDDYDRYESLPDWARQTLEKHQDDPRDRYDRATLERGGTADQLWNAAQGQLRREGWFHNYMRMLWGKKILEWSPTGQEALANMIAIMNRWSLDGRNPNAYSGYFWTLGRYDRPWPERPVYGTVRCMTSASTARKFHVKNYIAEYAPAATAATLPLADER